MDPLILAAHIMPGPGDKILDIGCGCGIMPLILGLRHRDVRIVGIEIQEELAGFARRNMEENKLKERVRVLHRDLSLLDLEEIQGPSDWIISNPPFKKKDTGRLNPDPQKALARHEIKLDLDSLFSNGKRLLKPRGIITIIFPAQRVADIFSAMAGHGFQPDWLRFIHIRRTEPAKLVLASGIKNGNGPCIVRPPFIINHESGSPTQEYSLIFSGKDEV